MPKRSREYLDAVAAIREVLNRFDPEGLLAVGAPDDEYQPEAHHLVRFVLATKPPTREAVQAVWNGWFGIDMKTEIAESINIELHDLRASTPVHETVERIAAALAHLIGQAVQAVTMRGGAMATYVLIHGTGSGGWLWDPVATRLRAAGHGVHAPTLIGVGERATEGGPGTDLTTHVEQVVLLVESLSAPRVILVGFSYSGLVVEGAAATIPERIAQLVFVDALLVPHGRSGFDAFPAEDADRFRAAAHDRGDGWKLPPFPLERVGGIGPVESGVDFAGVEQALLERRGSHPIGSYEERVTWDAASLVDVARRYVICTAKPPPMQERLTARARELRESGCTVDELPTGHFPMRSMPNALTAILLSCATLGPASGEEGRA